MGIEFLPAAIAPEGFQAHEGFIPGSGPELPGAFEAALVLTAGGLDGARTQRLVGELDLLRGGGSGRHGLFGIADRLVFHAVSVVLEVFDLGLEFLLLGFQQTGFDLGQGRNDGEGLVVANLLEERCDPGGGLGGATTIKVVGDGPEMFLGVPEIQLLAGMGEAVQGEFPNPESSVGNDEHLLGLGQAPLEGLSVELGGERLQAQASGHIAALADEGALAGGLAAVVQAEDRRHVNPVPALEFLALEEQFFSLAPIIALADVPSIDFNDQGEWLGGRSFGVARQLLNV